MHEKGRIQGKHVGRFQNRDSIENPSSFASETVAEQFRLTSPKEAKETVAEQLHVTSPHNARVIVFC